MEVEKYSTAFLPGQIVVLKSNPSIRGAVVEVLPGQPESRVKVFMDGSVQTYYAPQLKAEDQANDDLPSLSRNRFHAHLTAPSDSTSQPIDTVFAQRRPRRFYSLSVPPRAALHSIRPSEAADRRWRRRG